ncbi:hypothetical protein COJ01_12070 [Priestia megaterium]|uniref:hypothetical protein n=1 Tax=Priestia megaterium TaxID=1404 RepID=UPI000BF83131|nr:hypothetical protein [Priestia megaterium]PFL01190.1 hypothetical protein COJ01_12070 [Priestia megaterium]
MSVQALSIYERARNLEEAGWAVIESIDLNADMQELQEEAFDTVLAARKIQWQSLSRVERIVADMKSKGVDVDIVPRYLKFKEETSYV